MNLGLEKKINYEKRKPFLGNGALLPVGNKIKQNKNDLQVLNMKILRTKKQ